jgi:hypothetical protein
MDKRICVSERPILKGSLRPPEKPGVAWTHVRRIRWMRQSSLLFPARYAQVSVHVHFHPFGDPRSSAVTAFIVNPVEYFINDILLLLFLSLRK